MAARRLEGQFRVLFDLAGQLYEPAGADALLLLVAKPLDWEKLKVLAGDTKVVIAADEAEQCEGAQEAGLEVVVLDMAGQSVHDKLSQSLIECVADDILPQNACVIALYSGFEAGAADTLSVINLDEHFGRLTARDLRQLETKVPLDTLKAVVDLAVEIGREGREGKRVGTMFVIGDTRKVLSASHPMGFDPVRGYKRQERNLDDHRVREGVKEIAQLDGAFVVSPDGTIESAVRFINAPAASVTLSKGLGSRHWAAAAITKTSKSVAVAVSESNGTVRIFQDGEVVLRIEPFQRPLKWRDFEFDRPPAADE